MVTVFANNQAMTAVNAVASEIFTEPVSLDDNDRATVMWNIHYLWAFDAGGGGATGTAGYEAEVSNDGVYWVGAAGGTDTSTTPTGSTPKAKSISVNGAFLRFKLTLNATAGDLAGCGVDLHVKLDHA